jgi:hypothetical protein
MSLLDPLELIGTITDLVSKVTKADITLFGAFFDEIIGYYNEGVKEICIPRSRLDPLITRAKELGLYGLFQKEKKTDGK